MTGVHAVDQQQYAFAGLGQSPSMGGFDALQAMALLQSTQGSTDPSVSSSSTTDIAHLLTQLPGPPGLSGLSPPGSSSPQQLLHTDPANSPLVASEQWVQTTSNHSGSISPASSPPQEPSGGPRVFVPDSLKAGSAATTSPNQQVLLQAALGQQSLTTSADAASLLPLLQEQLLLQSLQQQTASAAHPNMAALAAAVSAGAGGPPGLAQQPLAGPLAAALANTSTAGLWPFVPPSLADPTGAAATAAAATAAALLAAQQQQQQQAALTRALASTGLVGGIDQVALLQQLLLSQQGLAGAASGSAASGVLNQLQPWAMKALTAQLQQQGAAFSQQQLALANLLNTPGMVGALAKPNANNAQGRRSRTGRRSSGTAAAADMAGIFGAPSPAGSTAGSDISGLADGRAASGLPAVLPAGVTVQDLCPTKYEDTWGAPEGSDETTATTTATATSLSSTSSCQLARGSSSASSSSIESVTESPSSLCGSALSISSRQGSGNTADPKWQWDSHFCSLDDDAGAKGSSGVAGRAVRKASGAAAKQAATAQQQAADDTVADKDQGADAAKAASAAAGGCAVWIPGAREAAGDDSWYLPRPPTCRLFVGNIGCWVDEVMLLAYFGKYGHVVDVQVRLVGKGWLCRVLLTVCDSPSTCLLRRCPHTYIAAHHTHTQSLLKAMQTHGMEGMAWS